MNIELTPEQYRTLLKTIFIANWILPDEIDEEHSDSIEKFQNLFQTVLVKAGDFGAKDLVEYDEESKEHILGHEMDHDSDLMHVLEEFNDRNFWEELLYRLVSRDMIEKFGEKTLEEMEPEERMEKEQDFFDRYGDEFETNGLDNLRLK